MVRNRMRRFSRFPAAVTILALLLAPCAGADDVPRKQMGGSIQGAPLSLSGVTSTIAGVSRFRSRDGRDVVARFFSPAGITTDGTNLYVADTGNKTIRKVVISTGTVTTLAGKAGSSGTTDGVGAAARFGSPAGVSTDGSNLYVADCDSHTIRRVEISTGAVTTLAGKAGSSGSVDGTGTAARFHLPHGITTDGTSLYVADTNNSTIRRIVIATGAVTTLAGNAGSYGNTDGTGATARFNCPYGITTDGTSLYVADTNNFGIRRIVIATAAVTTLAGTAGSYGNADGTGTAAKFGGPSGITTDGTNLYVTDMNNSTIRKIVIATGAVTTLAGNARATGLADGAGATVRFNFPSGVTTDGTRLYVADTVNNMIRKID